jgi:hypothetical protein
MDRIDCQSAERLIHLELDGELRAEDARLLEQHLERCESCRELSEELHRVDGALREGLGALEVGEPAAEATRQRIGRTRRSRPLWGALLPAAAAFVLVALTLLVAAPRMQNAQTPAAPATVVSGGDAIHVFGPDERTAQPGRTGTALQERSVAWGMGDEPIGLEFAGGARVGLSEEAVVRIGRESIDLFKGSLRADLRESEGGFSVVTPWGELSGSGSQFLIHSDVNGSSARVAVISGEVRVVRGERVRVIAENESMLLKPDPTQTITL